MNKVINRLLVSMCLVLWASALSAQMHWSFDYQAYQHDMTIYFTLQNGSEAVSNLDDYEVAAFVGNECRGIGKFLSQNDVTYGKRVRKRRRIFLGLPSPLLLIRMSAIPAPRRFLIWRIMCCQAMSMEMVR